MTTEAKTGFVTLDEVRSLLGDTDPNQMTLTAMRKLLGVRGSFGTIDKFLNILRAERAAALAPPTEPGTMPAMPVELGVAMWSAAWTAAQVTTLKRTENLVAERDAALLKLEAQSLDSSSLINALDEQTLKLEQVQLDLGNELAEAKIEEASARQDLESYRIATEGELMTLKNTTTAEIAKRDAEISRITAAAEAAAAIAERDAKITAAAMQATIDRLTDQVAELKSIIHRPEPALLVEQSK